MIMDFFLLYRLTFIQKRHLISSLLVHLQSLLCKADAALSQISHYVSSELESSSWTCKGVSRSLHCWDNRVNYTLIMDFLFFLEFFCSVQQLLEYTFIVHNNICIIFYSLQKPDGAQRRMKQMLPSAQLINPHLAQIKKV